MRIDVGTRIGACGVRGDLRCMDLIFVDALVFKRTTSGVGKFY